ncbi:Uncharacterised protein [Mycobacteroides abscessus subsp. abscessus]|nr:Uncharacterised protein [Mycobacteroides abscessus subsp. abscessus]SHU69396.1 Uncharacterised protein [Mycobacteroides abscessus subsp. abscessus]
MTLSPLTITSPISPRGTSLSSGSTILTSQCGAARPAERSRAGSSWSSGSSSVATGDTSVMPYAWVNRALGNTRVARCKTASEITDAP